MTITLGKGEYSISSAHRVRDGLPCLTVRKLPAPCEPGIILKGKTDMLDAFDVVLEIETPAAAASLLITAQAIAFAHGIPPSTRLPPGEHGGAMSKLHTTIAQAAGLALCRVRCDICKREQAVGGAKALASGWPTCCRGYTMTLLPAVTPAPKRKPKVK